MSKIDKEEFEAMCGMPLAELRELFERYERDRRRIYECYPLMLEMLKRLEWQGDCDCHRDICPLCGADYDELRTHHYLCALAELIAKAEGRE